MRNQWVLEWSQSTNNFHIQPLEYTLAGNQERFLADVAPNDYHVIFVGEKDACHRMADNNRQKIHERDKERVTDPRSFI